MAKKITLGILIVSVIVGLVLLFFKTIPMDRFEIYVKAVAFLYTPLIASIGINSGIEKFKDTKDNEKCLDENQRMV